MKSFIPGLIVGIVLCAVAGYLILMPKIQESYAKGYSEGNAAGVAAGTAKGIEEGIAKSTADMQARQQKSTDSLAALMAKQQAAHEATARKPREAAPKIQNWHVIGGQIQDPITDTAAAY